MKTIVRINIDSKMDDLELNIENRSIVNILNKNSNNIFLSATIYTYLYEK